MYIQSDSDDLESVPLALLRRDVGTSDEVGNGGATDDEVCKLLALFVFCICICICISCVCLRCRAIATACR